MSETPTKHICFTEDDFKLYVRMAVDQELRSRSEDTKSKIQGWTKFVGVTSLIAVFGGLGAGWVTFHSSINSAVKAEVNRVATTDTEVKKQLDQVSQTALHKVVNDIDITLKLGTTLQKKISALQKEQHNVLKQITDLNTALGKAKDLAKAATPENLKNAEALLRYVQSKDFKSGAHALVSLKTAQVEHHKRIEILEALGKTLGDFVTKQSKLQSELSDDVLAFKARTAIEETVSSGKLTELASSSSTLRADLDILKGRVNGHDDVATDPELKKLVKAKITVSGTEIPFLRMGVTSKQSILYLGHVIIEKQLGVKDRIDGLGSITSGNDFGKNEQVNLFDGATRADPNPKQTP